MRWRNRKLFASKQKHYKYNTAAWRKSTFCDGGGCVEFMQINQHTVAIRDSKKASQQPLMYTRKEWAMFIKGVKNGEFDI